MKTKSYNCRILYLSVENCLLLHLYIFKIVKPCIVCRLILFNFGCMAKRNHCGKVSSAKLNSKIIEWPTNNMGIKRFGRLNNIKKLPNKAEKIKIYKISHTFLQNLNIILCTTANLKIKPLECYSSYYVVTQSSLNVRLLYCFLYHIYNFHIH